jgi:DNA-binding phage protein
MTTLSAQARSASPRADSGAGWLGDVPTRSGFDGQPRSFVAAGSAWPEGPFEAGAPVTVRYAAAIVVSLRAAIAAKGWTNTLAASEIGINRQSLQAILSGRVLPDLHTLARAEEALGARLWPAAD